jgi:hypothetical protein
MDETERPLRVGDVLEGYAGGWIKSTAPTVCVEAIGTDWVVVRARGWNDTTAIPLRIDDPDRLTAYLVEEDGEGGAPR